jgi:hypothetical protein
MAEFAECDESVDFLGQRLHRIRIGSLDDDADRECPAEHADGVALGVAIGAGREFVLRVHVEAGGGPSLFGSSIADENAAAYGDRAE